MELITTQKLAQNATRRAGNESVRAFQLKTKRGKTKTPTKTIQTKTETETDISMENHQTEIQNKRDSKPTFHIQGINQASKLHGKNHRN